MKKLKAEIKFNILVPILLKNQVRLYCHKFTKTRPAVLNRR